VAHREQHGNREVRKPKKEKSESDVQGVHKKRAVSAELRASADARVLSTE
jgi:hypothetical protein